MIKNFKHIFAGLCLTGFGFLAGHAQTIKGLKDYYKNYYPIGVAVSMRDLNDSATRRFIVKQFNSVTAENAMKMGAIHPREDKYNWQDADAIVAFAYQNHIKIRGHNLCWHNQTPSWIFKKANGDTVDKQTLLLRLKQHIQTVVGRYKGKVYAWDVVNEAVADGGQQALRQSDWLRICGEEYIYKAFEYAHAADPDAVLFYNDYGTENPQKRERIYQLLARMLKAGIPVHGVGLQGHWSVSYPSKDELTSSIQKFASLGLQVQITEMDISVYRADERNAKDTLLTTSRAQQQALQYQKLFEVLRANKKLLTGVTFWNVSDRHSWLDDFPVRGRKDYPLLFDENLKPKRAYYLITH